MYVYVDYRCAGNRKDVGVKLQKSKTSRPLIKNLMKSGRKKKKNREINPVRELFKISYWHSIETKLSLGYRRDNTEDSPEEKVQ